MVLRGPAIAGLCFQSAGNSAETTKQRSNQPSWGGGSRNKTPARHQQQDGTDLKVPFKCPHSCTATGTLTNLALSFRLKSFSCAVKTSRTGSSFQTRVSFGLTLRLLPAVVDWSSVTAMFTFEGQVCGGARKARNLTDDNDAPLLFFTFLLTRDSKNAAFSTTKH